MSETETDASETAADESAGPVERIRSVTPFTHPRPDAEMDAIGWALFLGVVILLLPLLPIIIVVWALTKVLDALAPTD